MSVRRCVGHVLTFDFKLREPNTPTGHSSPSLRVSRSGNFCLAMNSTGPYAFSTFDIHKERTFGSIDTQLGPTTNTIEMDSSNAQTHRQPVGNLCNLQRHITKPSLDNSNRFLTIYEQVGSEVRILPQSHQMDPCVSRRSLAFI